MPEEKPKKTKNKIEIPSGENGKGLREKKKVWQVLRKKRGLRKKVER